VHRIREGLLGSGNAPPPAVRLVSPKRFQAAENIEFIRSKSCRQPYMLPSRVMRCGMALDDLGTAQRRKDHDLYRNPLMQAADPALAVGRRIEASTRACGRVVRSRELSNNFSRRADSSGDRGEGYRQHQLGCLEPQS